MVVGCVTYGRLTAPELLFLNAFVVHSFNPAVVAVAVNPITTVLPGAMSFTEPPDRLNRIKPDGGEASTAQVPGLVGVTVTKVGVPAPAGILTVTDPMF